MAAGERSLVVVLLLEEEGQGSCCVYVNVWDEGSITMGERKAIR